MQASQLLVYTQSRPFEPFRIFVADGRRIDVLHPEMTMVAKYAMTLWLFHPRGELEVLDAGHITGLRTMHAVDPEQFAASQIEE